MPGIRQARLEAQGLVAGLGMVRAGGNLSEAARQLGISRKVLRDHLRRAGLYPWPLSPAKASSEVRKASPVARQPTRRCW
ncbi:MAG: hypothetical protein K0V04_15815 [Deltaproteobacteria bacterium]|nr:hypothetical protein [Deltaproteobacteria bacterium]